MGFPGQEYWSELPFPSPGIFLTQGSNPRLFHLLNWQADSSPLYHLGSPKWYITHHYRNPAQLIFQQQVTLGEFLQEAYTYIC